MADVDVITQVLDGPWAELRQALRRDLDPDLFIPLDPENSLEEHRRDTTERLLRATEVISTHNVLEPSEPAKLVIASEMLGHANLSLFVKSGVQFGLFAGVIANLGTDRHRRDVLPKALDCSLLGCFAMTESDHGSDVQSLETTATYDPATDEIVITTPHPGAQKEYIGNAARDGRMAAVFAQLEVDGTNHGVHCILVPIRDEQGEALPGVWIGDCGAKMGLPGVDNGQLRFDAVRVPRTNLLDRYGTIGEDGTYSSPIDSHNRRFFTMLGTLVRGRISVGGAGAAAARSGLTLAVQHALGRRQFPNPLAGDEGELLLLDYQTHQLKLLPLIARSYALAAAQNELVGDLDRIERRRLESPELDDEHDRRELEARAAGLKAVQTRHTTDTLQICREACGGAGYMAVNRFAALKADTDVFTTFEGDNTVLLQLAGKALLTRYQTEVSDLDPVGIARFAARQVTGAMIERVGGSGLVQRLIARGRSREAESPLADRGGQLVLIEDRERHLLDTLAARMRSAPKDDPVAAAQVFNRCQDHLVATAEAHVERIALEALVEAVDEVGEPGAREVLDLVCDLFVHDLLHRHRAWYLEHGRISSGESKDVVRRRADLCAQLRPHAALLVEAFAIPAPWLTNELATA